MRNLFTFFYKSFKTYYYYLILWIDVIMSIKINSKPLYIFNHEIWHLTIDYKSRKEKYRKFLKKKGYNVIYLDLKSPLMVFFLDIFLNGFSFKFYKNKKLNVSFTSKFFASIKYSYWDLNIRKKNFVSKKITIDKEKYKKIFNNICKKSFDHNYWTKICRIFRNKKISCLVLTQQAYEELPLARLALDNNVKVIYFETLNGIEVIKPSKKSFMSLTATAFNKSVKLVKDSDLKKHNSIIQNRVNGSEDDSLRGNIFPTKNKIKSKFDKTYSFLEFKSKKVLCLYLHCFTDSPNYRRDTEDYSIFIDFYEWALYLVEYCAKNKVPIIIKPHPHSKYYSNDNFYLASLKRALHKFSNSHELIFRWVNVDFKSFYLTKIANPIVVTARGTVVAESSYLGIPSISFCKSAWQNLKNLTYLVKDKNEFEKIFPIIETLFNKNLAKKEAVILSEMLDRGLSNMSYKIGPRSSTDNYRHSLDLSWKLRKIL